MLIEQRSREWLDMRKGKITSSEIYKIMGEGKGKEKALSDTGKTYLLQKISERMGGFTPPATGEALEWGTDLEETARKIYEASTGLVVEPCSFISVNEYYGGSPDSIVNPDGVLEIKCPYNTVNHLKYALITTDAEFKKANPNYYYQCISHMNVTGAKWCDFVTFDPRVDAEYIMFTYRLHRNEDEINLMNEKIEVAVEYMKELVNKITKVATLGDIAETAEK